MANYIEKRLTRAISGITPDMLPQILRRIDESERESAEDVYIPDVADDMPTNKRTVSALRKWTTAVAAALVLTFGSYFAYGNLAVDSVIGIDVNPSIQIAVNKNEKILSVTALNEDAIIMLDGMNLINVDLDVAVNAMIGSMLKNGYLSEIANSILISVENNDAQKAAELQRRLSESVGSLLSAYAIDGSVISQSYTGKDAEIEALALEYGISYSKAELIHKLIATGSTLSFADAAALPVNDIKLLIEAGQAVPSGVVADGSASSAAYIGTDRAREIALSYCGIDGAEATFVKSKMDFDDGRMTYEIEFYCNSGKYELEIDAKTGDILEFDFEAAQTADNFHDELGNAQHSASVDETDDQSKPVISDEGIGIAAAKDIALKNAGLSASQVTFTKTNRDVEDGHHVYEIEFICGGYEYEYEIHAGTGAILDCDMEFDGGDKAKSERKHDKKDHGDDH